MKKIALLIFTLAASCSVYGSDWIVAKTTEDKQWSYDSESIVRQNKRVSVDVRVSTPVGVGRFVTIETMSVTITCVGNPKSWRVEKRTIILDQKSGMEITNLLPENPVNIVAGSPEDMIRKEVCGYL